MSREYKDHPAVKIGNILRTMPRGVVTTRMGVDQETWKWLLLGIGLEKFDRNKLKLLRSMIAIWCSDSNRREFNKLYKQFTHTPPLTVIEVVHALDLLRLYITFEFKYNGNESLQIPEEDHGYFLEYFNNKQKVTNDVLEETRKIEV